MRQRHGAAVTIHIGLLVDLLPAARAVGIAIPEHPRRAQYDLLMQQLVVHWVLSGVALLIVTKVLPGIEVDGFAAALIAALVIGFVSATVGFILKLILLPFVILSLGIVYFLINGLMLKLASALVPGFRVVGCLPAVLGSILLTVVDYVLNQVVGI